MSERKSTYLHPRAWLRASALTCADALWTPTDRS